MTHPIPRIGTFGLAVIACSLSGCGLLTQLAPNAELRLQEQLEKHLADPRLAGCQVGLAVYSLDRRTWVFERFGDRRFVPASNIKLVTGAAALHLLGPAYRAITEVRFAGSKSGGAWQGQLALTGGGDPLLSSADLAALVHGVTTSGLRRFTGTVLADDTRFDTRRWGAGWMWDDIGTDDAPAVSALTVNLNRLNLIVQPASLNHPLVVRPEPFTGYGQIDNRGRTLAQATPLDVHCQPENGLDVVHVSGALAPGSAEVRTAISVTDPATYGATLFSEALGRAGIPLQVQVGRTGAAGGEVVASHASAPVAEMVRQMHKESVNLIAEMLVKQVGAVKGGVPGTFDKGLTAAGALLTEIGWPPETYRIVDGSGLSRYNLVSPRQFTQLLAWMDQQPTGEVYRRTLPIGGVDGTLATRFQGVAGADRITAKTGTLTGVSALSGYVVAKSGERLAFSCLVNGGTGGSTPVRQAQDALVTDLLEWQR